jgi:glycosyltransferase involved in cell wall biosynthesis
MAESPKNVAYLGLKGLPFPGGAESVTEGIVRHLDPERYHATVYCDSRIVPKDFSIPNVTLVHVPSLPGKHLRATTHFISSAVHALLHREYDLIHLHNAEASFILPLLKLRYPRIIATSHGQAQAREKWGKLAKTLMELTEIPFMWLADSVTSVSKPLAEYYEERYGRPVLYIPNGIEEQPHVPPERASAVLEKYDLEPGYVMFAAGRVIPSKGAHTLIEAFRELDDPDARLIIVGDTKQIPAYERKLLDLADDRVSFIPFISDREELRSLLQASKLFVFPSTIEAMSMMLLQVASFGIPVIYSDIPENLASMPESGIVFRAGDVDDLKRKLSFALDNPEEVNCLAEAAQKHVRAEHSWDRIVREYESLYG